MAKTKDNPLWFDRIGGGIILAAVAFGLLSFWNTWEFSLQTRALISGGIGAAFMIFGGNAMRWIRALDFWS